MRIHTNTHNAETIREALAKCQRAGLIAPAVAIDVLSAHGSRSRARAYEVSMGAPAGTPSFLADDSREQITDMLAGYCDDDVKVARVLKRAARRFSRSGYGNAPDDLPIGATWHEWGYFLAALFNTDDDLSVGGVYEDAETFVYNTQNHTIPGWALADPTFGIAGQGRYVDFFPAVWNLANPTAA